MLEAIDDKTRTVTGTGNPRTQTDSFEPGGLLGDYIIRRKLGAGGGGAVYAAEHRMLNRKVAIKVLHLEMARSAEMLARFIREARSVNLIAHPNIIDIFDFGELPDGRPYYVMELLDGVDLKQLILSKGRLSPEEMLGILGPVCAALEAAHRMGVIHRDLKASNILVVSQGGEPSVKLLDFGVAKLLYTDNEGAGITTMGTRLGTPFSMAPEQIRGETVRAQTDIYALGVMLFHGLTGKFPFVGASIDEIERKHLTAAPARPSSLAPLSPAVDAVILRCLEKKPEHRFESVMAVLHALKNALGVPAPAAAGANARAVGIYVEMRPSSPSAEMTDEFLDDATSALEAAETHIRALGYSLPVQTGTAFLAAKLLCDGLPQETLSSMQTLWKELTKQTQSGLQVIIALHLDEAVCAPESNEVRSGAILRTGRWVPPEASTGVISTPAFRGTLPV